MSPPSWPRPLREIPWVAAAEPAATVTDDHCDTAGTGGAAEMAAAAPACAQARSCAAPRRRCGPGRPDRSQQLAGRLGDQADTMTGRLAQAAARVTITSEWNGVRSLPGRLATRGRPYTRRRPTSARARSGTGWPEQCQGHIAQLRALSRQDARRHPLYPCNGARSRPSTLRWADDLQLERADPGQRLAALLGSPAEQDLLGLLSWLPVGVVVAARRRRPTNRRLPGADRGRWLICGTGRASAAVRWRGRARASPNWPARGWCWPMPFGPLLSGRTGADRRHGQRTGSSPTMIVGMSRRDACEIARLK